LLFDTQESRPCKEICSLKKNSSINDLVAEAQKLGRHRTKKEAISAALDEYVRKRKQLDVIEIFGKIDYDESYDYKLERHRKPRRQ
jgi:predicted CopG family antitoxin